jgi:hypothetical protein
MCDMEERINFQLCLESAPEWDTPDSITRPFPILVLHSMPQTPYFKVFGIHGSELLMIRADSSISALEFTEGLLNLVDRLNLPDIGNKITYLSLKEVYKSERYKHLQSTNPKPRDHRYQEAAAVTDQLLQAIVSSSKTRCFLVLKLIRLVFDSDQQTTTAGAEVLTFFLTLAQSSSQVQMDSDIKGFLTEAVKAPFIESWLKSVRHYPELDQGQYSLASYKLGSASLTPIALPGSSMHPERPATPVLVLREPCPAAATARNDLSASVNFMMDNEQELSTKSDKDSDVEEYEANNKAVRSHLQMEEPDKETKLDNLDDVSQDLVMLLRKKILDSTHKNYPQRLAENVLGLSEVHEALLQMPFIGFVDCVFRVTQVPAKHKTCRATKKKKCKNNHCYDHRNFDNLINIQESLVLEGQKLGKTKQLDRTFYSLHSMLEYFYKNAKIATRAYIFDHLLIIYEYHDSDLSDSVFESLIQHLYHEGKKDFLKQLLVLDHLFTPAFQAVLSRQNSPPGKYKVAVRSILEEFQKEMESYLIQEVNNYTFLRKYLGALTKAYEQDLISEYSASRIVEKLSTLFIKPRSQDPIEGFMLLFSVAGDSQVVKKICFSVIFRKLNQDRSPGILQSFWSSFKRFFGKENRVEIPEEICDYIINDVISDPQRVLVEMIDPKENLINQEVFEFLETCSEKEGKLKIAFNQLKHRLEYLLKEIVRGDMTIEHKIFLRIDKKERALNRLSKHLGLSGNIDEDDFKPILEMFRVQSYLYKDTLDKLRKLCSTNIEPFSSMKKDAIHQNIACIERTNVTLADIQACTRYVNRLSNLIKAVELFPFNTLHDFISQHGKQQSSAEEMEQTCKKALEALAEQVELSRKIIKRSNLDMLKKLSSELSHYDLRRRVTTAKLLNAEDCRDLESLILGCDILDHQHTLVKAKKEVTLMLSEIKKLREETSMQSGQDGLIEKIYRLSNSWTEKYNCNSKELLTLVNNNRNDLEVLKGRSELIENLSRLKDLYKFFKDKQPKHFENMLFDSGEFTSLDIQDITGMQKILEAFNTKTKFDSEFDFIKVCCKSLQSVNIVKIIEKAESLKLCSDAILKGDNNGQKIVEVLHEGGIICFKYLEEANTYLVVGVTSVDYSEGARLISQQLKDGFDIEPHPRLIGHQKLKDTKIRVAVITSDQSGQLSGNQAGFQEKIRTFATIMDNIECIHHHLNILMRVGEILNLKAFMEQLVRKERSLSLSNPFKNQDHSPLDIIRQTFEIQGNDLFIVTNPELPDSLVDKTMHFKAFKELLENYTYTRNQIIFEKMRKFHILSHMNGKQKLLLSKTLTNVDTKNSLQAIPSILEFVTGTTITKLPFKPGSASPEVLVDDVLLKFFEDKGFFTPNNDEDRPLQQSNSKKIKFLRYRSKRKYEDIFDFSSSKGKRILTAQRIMFVSHLTPFPEVDDFLMKAFCDPTGGYYFLCDLHLMRPEATSKLMLVCKLHLEKNAGINLNCVFMISRDHPRSSMLTEMIKHSHIFEEEISFRPDGKQHQPQSRASLQAQYVVSDLPGMGKTFYIEEEAKKSRQELVSMFIGGDPSKKCLEKRLEIIDNFMRNSQGKFLLHLKLDMMDNMEESLDLLDHLLFKLCYLRCIEYRDGYLYLKNVQFIYIEVQNSYKDLILERVNFLRICQPHSIPVLSLDWMNKHLNHGFIGDQKIRTVCSFFLALQDKRLGTASTTNLVDVHFAATNQIKSEVINRILIQILFSNSEVARQLENSGTVQILVYLINVLYYQITQMESVGGLNPSIYQIDSGSPNYQEFIDSLTDSRLTTGRIVFQLAKDLIWSSAKEIREEKMLGTQIIGSSVLSNKNSALRKEYLKKVTSIPKWELAGQLNIFFNEGAMKVLYRDVEQVTNQIKSLIKHQTGKDLEDLSRLSPESRQIKLLGELAEALNLFVTKQVSDEIQNLNPNLRREDIILQSLILEMKNFHQKGYVLTHDNFLKIIMIYQRAVLGIPIVIMGATGCGKTYLIDFISSCLLEEPFILFSMHSGITEKELEDRLLEAYKLAKQDDHRRVWFLFDEFNTSPLQCLISDIMIRRSCSFSLNLANIRFPNNLVFVAACNPFRLASHITKEGLQHDQASLMILAHRVYPIPESLISNIWDFGQLTKEDESEYIMNILDSHGGLIGKDHLKSALCIIIITCQNFLRVKCFDNSVSLRDVKRVVTLFVFFATKYDNPVDPLALTAYLCYFCRLPSESLKQNLSAILTKSLGLKDNIILIFTHRAREYAEELRNMEVVPESISINFPLAENLLAVTACVLNKIPLIICGKPGTSKTLAAKIFQTAIQLPEDQKQSCRLLRESPKVYFMPLWGSLTMTSEAVLQSFRKAEDRKQKLHAQGSTSGNRPDSAENKPIVCVVFDEIGIAEIAPENPLKVLHALLDPQEQTLAFIGMSNWMLDQSKMNRVIFVSRPDMTVEDLIQTCQKESLRGEFSKKYLEFIFSRLDALAKAYYQFREKEKEKAQGGHPNFHGSRDFYETVKTFKRNLSLVIDSTNDDIIGLQEHEIVDSLMLNAIHRNFSGKAISSTELSHQFMTRLIAENCATLKSSIFNDSEIGNRLKTIDLIYQNLTDTNSRHLMIICGSATVEELLVKEIRTFEVEIKKKDSNKIVSLYQGKGREEMVRTVMTKLPLYVKNGYTLIMKDLPEVYGCMYDLLNQNYSKSTDANDRECDLHFENDKATVQVHKDFKCIILMERDDALGSKEDIEAKQQPPFLNRFEKYLIREEDFIEPEKQEVLKEINKIFIEKTASSLYAKPQSVFHNMSKEMLYSAVIDDVSMITKNLQSLPHAGDGSTIYLGYLENVLICINRDTKLNKPTRSALQKSKTSRTKSSESDHKLIENSLLAIEVKKKIISLASRNMIIQNHLFQIAYNLPETFKEDFLESHEFDSFLDYEKQFISGARGLTRAIIFTYSAVWELRSIIRDHYRLKLIEANLLHQKGSGETSSLSLDITLDSAEVLIVQFSNRSEWAIMQKHQAAARL